MTKVLIQYNNQEEKDQQQNSKYKPNSAVKQEFQCFQKKLKFTVLIDIQDTNKHKHSFAKILRRVKPIVDKVFLIITKFISL